MSMDKPFHIEVTVDAPRDVVWRAVSEPERIRHWFGWDYDGLEDEIEQIFVDGATLHPPERVDLGDHAIELHDLGDDRTLIRVVKPGDASGWDGVYGDIEEGWITFFNQLRHRLERHPDARRRMIVRKAPSFPEPAGEPWHASAFQRGVEAADGSLAIVFGKPGEDQTLLVTTYDLDDRAFAAAERRWDEWITPDPTHP
jgi:uncharacterized protein YndB with AHSA1/START domain